MSNDDRLAEIKALVTEVPYRGDPNVAWLIAEVERARAENEHWLTKALEFEDFNARVAVENEIGSLRAEAARLRALVSWIDGMLVDGAGLMEIREGISRVVLSGDNADG